MHFGAPSPGHPQRQGPTATPNPAFNANCPPPLNPPPGVLGASNQAARVGGIVAPFIALAGTTHNSSLIPFLTFGIAALVSGVLIFTLPETLGAPLPDTMQARAAAPRSWVPMNIFTAALRMRHAAPRAPTGTPSS